MVFVLLGVEISVAVSDYSKEANLQTDIPCLFFHGSAQHSLLRVLIADVQRKGQEMLRLRPSPASTPLCVPW